MQLKGKEKRDFLFCFSGRNVRKHENKHRRWGGQKSKQCTITAKKETSQQVVSFALLENKAQNGDKEGLKKGKAWRKLKEKSASVPSQGNHKMQFHSSSCKEKQLGNGPLQSAIHHTLSETIWLCLFLISICALVFLSVTHCLSVLLPFWLFPFCFPPFL